MEKLKKESCVESSSVLTITFLNLNHEELPMNKSELINSLSEETTFSKRDVSRVLESFTRIVERTLKSGNKVAITGFGSFTISRRPARKGINPATKQRIDLPEICVPKFKPGKNLRETVRSVKAA